jgi:hypothetical protein
MLIPTRARTSALGGYVTGHGVSASQCLCNQKYMPGSGGSCVLCPANSYCEGYGTPSKPCPTNLFSMPGSHSFSQCDCPTGAFWYSNASICICTVGLYQMPNPDPLLNSCMCGLCPLGDQCS